MRVMIINAIAGRGSTGRICTELADELIKEGNEVSLLYASGYCACNYATKISNNFLVKFNSLLSRVFGLIGYFNFNSTHRVVKQIKRFKPEIIHLHNVHAHFLNLKAFLRFVNKNDIPLVITLHDCWFFTGKCMHYSNVNCLEWLNGCRNCVKLKQEIPSLFFNRTNEMWHDKKKAFNSLNKLGVIGVSDWIANEARRSFLSANATITTIYNWIDTCQFHYIYNSDFKRKYGINNDKKVVFCVAEKWINGTDRYNDLLKLADTIEEDYCILVGGAFEKIGTISPKIHLLGYLSVDDLATCYSNSDVYVHLSREDTFGKVIVEALSCGTPVITYNSTVYSEIIKYDYLGTCVETGDINAITKAVNRIVSRDNSREKLQAYVKKYFSKDILLGKTISFYREIINGGFGYEL